MESLLRVQVGRFRLEDSLPLSEIERLKEAGGLEEKIISIEEMFECYPPLRTLPRADRLACNGNPLAKGDVKDMEEGRYFRVYDSGGQFVGIYEWEQDKARLKPWKMFLGG